jgi:hypothetical protein
MSHTPRLDGRRALVIFDVFVLVAGVRSRTDVLLRPSRLGHPYSMGHRDKNVSHVL